MEWVAFLSFDVHRRVAGRSLEEVKADDEAVERKGRESIFHLDET